jgi:protein involved in polysaccharide export with SLBB domain
VVEQLANLRVYVMGYVQRPGEVDLPPEGMGMMQAIAAAGGFDEHAMPQETVLMRVTEAGFLLRQVDFSHLERRGIPHVATLDVQPYDVIYVPRSTIGDVDYFARTVLKALVSVGQIFWDVYAIANVDKVTSIFR